jgi:hypothetical protein
MNKVEIAERYGTTEEFVLMSGRKCRQKARKLSENSMNRVIVVSKKGNLQFESYYGSRGTIYSNIYRVVFVNE